jgi:hypothetical protein
VRGVGVRQARAAREHKQWVYVYNRPRPRRAHVHHICTESVSYEVRAMRACGP